MLCFFKSPAGNCSVSSYIQSGCVLVRKSTVRAQVTEDLSFPELSKFVSLFISPLSSIELLTVEGST